MNDTSRPARRLGLLDGLRLAAALCVVLYHYTAWGHDYWGANAPQAWPVLSQFSRYGQLGVQLFFLISGFVILKSAEGRSVGQFAASRIARLYPAYWLAVLAASALTFIGWPQIADGRTPGDALLNLSMAQGAVQAPDMDGVFWTLWVELKFYLLLGLLLALRQVRPGRMLGLCLAWPAAGLAAQAAGMEKLGEWICAPYASLFAAGMALYLIHQHGHSLARWLVLAANAGLSAWLAGIKGHADARLLSNLDVPAWHFALLVLLCVAVLLAVVLTPLSKVHAPFLAAAGALTYPLYLFHQLWGWWLIARLHQVVERHWLLAGIVLLMLGWAWLVSRYVEALAGPRLRAACLSCFAAAHRAIRALKYRRSLHPAP